MSNVKFKLQNIILKSNKYLDDHIGMMYRGDSFNYNKIKSAFTLKAGDFVEFFLSRRITKLIFYANIMTVFN